MTTQIYDAFSKLDITVGNREIQLLEKLVIGFETRGSHVLALNGQLLAVHQMVFTDQDRAGLFEIFGLREADVIKLIDGIPAINKNFKVTSEPFNVLTVWLLHLGYLLIKVPSVKHRFMVNLTKLLQYKFMTSFVKKMLPYGANEAIMLATISQLSRKFELITYGTWKAAIEARSVDVIGPNSIHYKTIATGKDDGAFIYVLSDIQTRIRDRLKLVIFKYHEVKKQGGYIGTKASSMEIDGKKILTEMISIQDVMIANTITEITNVNAFVRQDTVHAVAKQFNTISSSMFRQILIQMSELAATQVRDKSLDKIQVIGGEHIATGMRILVTDIIQTSLRYCAKQGISLNNKAIAYIKIRDAYSASRISDPDINRVKNSVGYMIDGMNATPRPSTRSSLRIAVIMYVLLKAMSYLR